MSELRYDWDELSDEVIDDIIANEIDYLEYLIELDEERKYWSRG